MRYPKLTSLILMIILAGLVACAPAGSSPSPVPIQTALTPSSSSEMPSTPTSAVSEPSKAVIISEGNPWEDRVITWIRERTTAQGWEVEVQRNAQLNAGDSSTALVVLLAPTFDVNALVAQHPNLPFIFIANAPLPESPNLTQVILRDDHLYFLAGYLAVLIAPDFRAGAVLPEGADTAVQAFRNGAFYLCGRCVPAYGPIVPFPVTATLAPNASVDTLQTTLTELNQNRLETLFVPAELLSPDHLPVLESTGWRLIGTSLPQDPPSNWAVTMTFDLAQGLETAWQAVLIEKQAATITVPITLKDINSQWLTPGRQRLAEQIIKDLQAGWIYPLTPP